MAAVRVKRGRLYIDFRWRGVRCREATKKRDSPANRAEVKRWARRIDGEIASGTFDYASHFPYGPKLALFSPPPSEAAGPHSFAEYARAWLDMRRLWLSPGTVYDYRKILDTHLIPHFGDRELSQIRLEDVEALLAAVKQRPGSKGPVISNRRANMILAVLRVCLNAAVEHGWLADNPVRRVKPLKEERSDIDPFTFEEVKRLLAAVRPETARYLIVAFFTGLRPSEQIGLQGDDIDWASKTIGVRRGAGRHGVGMTKTTSSHRDVTMLPMVERALKEQRAASQLRSHWVFPNQTGGALDITNLRERVWKPALRKAGLRSRTFYQTRHTFATLALASGEDIGWVAKMLGHTTTEMVIRRYHRFIPNLTRRDGSAISRLAANEGL